MMQVKILRIVLASPGDVQPERDTLEEAVAELNRGVAADRSLRLEVARWETDAFPGFHIEGPQGLIDSILCIEDCDVLIGIFWKRFGTPVADAQSGTAHEILKAYKAWKDEGRPHIMVYFNQEPYTPKSKEETDQWGQVLEFQRNFPKEGLWWAYKGKDEFKKLVREHLTQFIRQRISLSVEVAPAWGRFNNPPLPKGFVDRQGELDKLVKWLADEEESLFFLGGPAGRGKSYVASAFYGQVRESGEWEVRWIDCPSEPRLTLDVLLGTFAQELSQLMEQEEIEWNRQEDTERNRLADLINTGLPHHTRISDLIEILRFQRKKWLFVFDNYHEIQDSRVDEFLKFVAERSTGIGIKVLIVGRERPLIFRSLRLPTGAHREWHLAPLPEEEAPAYLSKLGVIAQPPRKIS
ncbi:MAG TPA: hypothetical protein VNP04_07355 [Alphaproteobacteria bacterium]|nr:hypothetical protein [Alphaproteobacteria bacterium]